MAKPLTGYKTERRETEDPNNKHKKKVDYVSVACPCYIKDELSPEALFYAGMLDPFLEAATKHGYEVEVIDGRDPNPMKLVPDLDKIPENMRYKQDDALQAIMANDKGIIHCGVGFGKSWLMSNLCLIYPTAKIVIVTAAKSLVEQTYKGLVDLLGKNEVGLIRGGTPSTEENKRVVVSTCASVMRAPLKNCDFLFFDEVHNVGFNRVFDNLVQNLGPARCFGFSASLTRGDGAMDAIRSLFGIVIAECTYQEAADHGMVTPMHAFMPTFTPTNITEQLRTPSENKVAAERHNYWRNTERNRWIADQAARAAAEFPNEQMLITVKTLEHALILHQMPQLSDWQIIYSGSIPAPEKRVAMHTADTAPQQVHARDTRTNEIRIYDLASSGGMCGYVSGDVYMDMLDAMRYLVDIRTEEPVARIELLPVKIAGIDVSQFKRTPKQVSEMVSKFASGEIRLAIATSMIKEGGNFPQLSHIFRADGSTSEVINTQFPGRASRLFSAKSDAIIIDPYDNWNKWVRGRAEARKKLYRKQGWLVE
jgi:superfamily II DNA or RNA helicase